MKKAGYWLDLGHHSRWSVVGHILGFLLAASGFEDQIHLSSTWSYNGTKEGFLLLQGDSFQMPKCLQVSYFRAGAGAIFTDYCMLQIRVPY